jgi:hypothetical protein
MYCTKQQTTCSLNTAVRMTIIKLRGQVLLAHPVILATGETESEIWRIKLPDQHYQSLGDPTSKIMIATQTDGVAQRVECLLCKNEYLTSNHSPTNSRFLYNIRIKRVIYV